LNVEFEQMAICDFEFSKYVLIKLAEEWLPAQKKSELELGIETV